MYPILLKLGPLTIYSFGAMMALGFLAASQVTSKELARRGYDGELASRFVVWAAVGGLIGARVWSVFNDWADFIEHPLQVLFSGSGLVFYGGLAGGFLAVSYAIRKAGVPYLTAIDCIAPGLPLAHAIGRIGCELAGDGDWGRPSTLPWAQAYPDAIIGWQDWVASQGLPADVRVHPTPIYEMVLYFAIFAFLWSIRKRALAPGSLLWLYFILGGVARFAVEFVRLNPAGLLGLTEAQWFSLLLIGVGVWRLAATAGKSAAPAPPAPAPPAKVRPARAKS
jgi:phosphatidylglycerol:prolipoprotein diacylglycerol transferase